MASGTRSKYALNLDDIIAFPDAGHMPVFPPGEGESWIVLLEITADQSFFGRPVYAVRDRTRSPFVVALYTSDPARDAKNFKIGHTLCIKSARPHQFMDGQVGFRIEDPSSIEKILPVSLSRLWEINTALRQRSDRHDLLKCNACNTVCKSGCVCKTRYCSKPCQRSDWVNHKGECVTVKALHGWNRTDFG